MQLANQYLIQLCFLFNLLETHLVSSQGTQVWTWLSGEKMIDKIGDNKGQPGGRSGSSIWSDTDNDTVWIFGGNGFTDFPTEKPHVLNDVWCFSKSAQKFYLQHPGSWTSKSHEDLAFSRVPEGRKHAAICGGKGMLVVFGGFGEGGGALGDTWTYSVEKREWTKVFRNCSEHNCEPAHRGHSAVWCYGSFMYIFGGLNDNKTLFNDMWRLDLSSLIWTQLENTESLGDNYPSSRNGAAAWVSSGVFYMFGGNADPSFSYSFPVTSGLVSDLWQYEPTSNRWTFLAGPRLPGQRGIYDTIGETSFTNTPGSRISTAPWVDSSGNLWLFGGAGTDVSTGSQGYISKLLSDVWRFHLGVQCWAFMGGSDMGGMGGRYKSLGESTEEGLPGGRTETLVWAGNENMVYLFGGLGHDAMHHDGYLNDLWSLDINGIVSREYEISPLIFYTFVGSTTALLSLVLLIALCRKQDRKPSSKIQRLDRNVKYSRLEMDDH